MTKETTTETPVPNMYGMALLAELRGFLDIRAEYAHYSPHGDAMLNQICSNLVILTGGALGIDLLAANEAATKPTA